jgi:hypothetical protein
MKTHPPIESTTDKDTYTTIPTLWNIVKEGKKSDQKYKPILCWSCVHTTLEDMGFRTWWAEGYGKGIAEFIRVQGNILDKVSREGIISFIVDEHIRPLHGLTEVLLTTEDGTGVTIRADDLIEVWKRGKNNILGRDQLAELKPYTYPILKDTAEESYFPFRNCIVKVTREGMVPFQYAELQDTGVWKSHIIQRDYMPHISPDTFMFADFIRNVANDIPDRVLSFQTAIGYLLHIHTSGDTAVAVIAYDEAVNDGRRANGGTGKGMIFAEAIKQLRNVTDIEGKAYSEDNHFQWNDITDETQIIYVDDPNKKFTLNKLFSLITNGLNIQRKHKGSLKKKLANSPKWYIATNYMLEGGDDSSDRRQHILTFSNYYSSRKNQGTRRPIVDTHGCRFFDDWDEDQWNAFYTYMIECVLLYMQIGLKPYTCSSVAISQIAYRTSTTFFEWVQHAGIKDGVEFKDRDLLDQYKAATDDSSIEPTKFYNYLRTYAQFNGLHMDRGGQGRRTLIFKKVTG